VNQLVQVNLKLVCHQDRLNPTGPFIELQKISIVLYQWPIGSLDETYCNQKYYDQMNDASCNM
jgi:hypothetical protein